MKDFRLQSQDGSGTVLALGLIALSLMLIVATVIIGASATAAARSARSADLSALAAADVARGITPGAPCEVAQEVATMNQVTLDSCEITGAEGTEVVIKVSVPIFDAFSPASDSRLAQAVDSFRATGISRAGPPAEPYR